MSTVTQEALSAEFGRAMALPAPMEMLSVDITTDPICPNSYLAYRRTERCVSSPDARAFATLSRT